MKENPAEGSPCHLSQDMNVLGEDMAARSPAVILSAASSAFYDPGCRQAPTAEGHWQHTSE